MQKNTERLPEDVLGAIRQNLGGTDEHDGSFDVQIDRMDAVELFKRWCEWEGLLGTYYAVIEEAYTAIFNTLGEDINDELYQESTHKTAMVALTCTKCGTDIAVVLGQSATCTCGTTYNIDVKIYREHNV